MYYHHHTGVQGTDGLVINGATVPRDSAGASFFNNRESFTPHCTLTASNIAAAAALDFYQTTPGLQAAGAPPLYYHPNPAMAVSVMGVLEELPTYPYSPHHFLQPFYHPAPTPTRGGPPHPYPPTPKLSHNPTPTPSSKKKRRATKEKPVAPYLDTTLASPLTRSGSRSKSTKVTHPYNGQFDTSPFISRSPPYVPPFAYQPPSGHIYDTLNGVTNPHPHHTSYWTPPPSLDFPDRSSVARGHKLDHQYSLGWGSGGPLDPYTNPATPMYQSYRLVDQMYPHPYHPGAPSFPTAPDNEPLNLCLVETTAPKPTPSTSSTRRRDVYRPSPIPLLYSAPHNFAPHPSPHPTYILEENDERHSSSTSSAKQPSAVIIATEILSHMARPPKGDLSYASLTTPTPSTCSPSHMKRSVGGVRHHHPTPHDSGTTKCSYIRTLLEKGAPYTYMYQKNGIPNVVPNYPFSSVGRYPAHQQPYNAPYDPTSSYSVNHTPKVTSVSGLGWGHLDPLLHRPYQSLGLKKAAKTVSAAPASCNTIGSAYESFNPSVNGLSKHVTQAAFGPINYDITSYPNSYPSVITRARVEAIQPPAHSEPLKASFNTPIISGPTALASLFTDAARHQNHHILTGSQEGGQHDKQHHQQGQSEDVTATLFDASLYRTRRREEEEEEQNESEKDGDHELLLGSYHSSPSSSPLDHDSPHTQDRCFGFATGATTLYSTPEAGNNKGPSVNSILSGPRLNNHFKSTSNSQLVKSRLSFNDSFPRPAFHNAPIKNGSNKPRSLVFSYTEYSGSEEDEPTNHTTEPIPATSYLSRSGKRFYDEYSKPTIMVHLALDLLIPLPSKTGTTDNNDSPESHKKFKLSPRSTPEPQLIPPQNNAGTDEFTMALITKIVDGSNRQAFHNMKGLAFLTDHLSPANRPSWAVHSKSRLSAQRRRLLSHRSGNSLTQPPVLAVCHQDGPHFHSPACDRRTDHPNTLRCIECCNMGSQTLNEITMPSLNDFKKLVPSKASGETILHTAARRNLKDICLYLIHTNEYDLNQKENAGYTAVQEACLAGSKDALYVLLSHGADPNCCLPDGTRPLHDAIEMDDISMVKLLLSFGADPTLKTYVGKSCLDYGKSSKMKAFLKKYIALYSNATNLKSLVEYANVTDEKILSQRAEMEETLPRYDTQTEVSHNSLTFEISDEPFIKAYSCMHNGKNVNAVRLIDLSKAMNFQANVTSLLEAHSDLKKYMITLPLALDDGDGHLKTDDYVRIDWAIKKLPNVSTHIVKVDSFVKQWQ